MLSRSELRASLAGAGRLARFDAGGHTLFERTTAGAARSFYAAVLLAPLYALTLALAFRSDTGEAAATAPAAADPLRYALVQAIAYVVSWTAYPVVVEWLSRRLDCRERFAAWLVAYNWMMVLQNGLVLLFSLLALSRLLPDDLLRLLWLMIFGLTLGWLWFIARTALAVPTGTAVGLVFFDVLMSVAIDSVSGSMS